MEDGFGFEGENAFATLAQALADAPQSILQTLVETSLRLCRADSAGITIAEADGNVAWPAVTGTWAGLPARPCSEWQAIVPVAVDSLVVPFHANGQEIGTIWVVSHTPRRRFDREDARLLARLSSFAAAGYQAHAALALEQRDAEHTHELSMANATLRQLVAERGQQVRTFDAVVSAVQDYVYLVDIDGRLTYASQSVLASLRRTLDEMIGQRPRDLGFVPELADLLELQIREVVETGCGVTDEASFNLPSGERYFQYQWAPVFDESGHVHAVAGSAVEITARKRAERNIALLGEVSADLASLVGGDEIIRATAQKITRFFGISKLSFVTVDQAGDRLTRLYKQHDEREVAEPRTARLSVIVGNEVRRKLCAGEVIVMADLDEHAQLLAAPIRYRPPGIRSMVLVPYASDGIWKFLLIPQHRKPRVWRPEEIELLRELTNRIYLRLERSWAEDALRASELALREADRRKDDFLATLSHELRNPLAPIRNGLAILRETHRAADEPVYEVMERQIAQMVRLVDDLLEVSRITSGKIELRRELVTIAAVIQSALETCRPSIELARHRITVSLPSEPLWLHVDPVRIGQVFSNLLNNAAKYMTEGGEIWLTTRSEGAHAVISVRDQGIGIEAEMLPSIFEMFSQISRDRGGLGIGLSLTRDLLALHDGRIEATSPGLFKGSEFIVYLPLSSPPAISRPPAPAPIEPLAHGRRVLVVDDNRDAANSLGTVLRLWGAEVSVVYEGGAALGELDRFAPDMIFLDLGMPRIDGYKVARHIRARPQYKHVVLVALTGWGQDEDLRRTQAAGFDHHLVKPPDVRTLRAMLASLDARAHQPQV
ncbi:MAG: domain S-box protein [Myxococcales bacterium]|nr:domain S-box protein [Myxococcales bacterium]